MSGNLEGRIASALAVDEITSAALSVLLAEAYAAIIEVDAIAEEERVKAMDPALSPDPRKARAAMEDATFAANRLRTLQPRLQKHYEHIVLAERKAAWIEQYVAIKPEHEALVTELKETYSDCVTKMVDMLSRIRGFDARAKAVMQAKPYPESGEPDDGRHLLPVECAARGMRSLYPAQYTLDRGLILPDFTQLGKNAWPPFAPAYL